VIEGNPLRAHWTGSALAALAYLAVLGSAVGFVALYWLLRRLPVTSVNSMMLVHPLVAMVLGWLVLGEHLTARIVVGAGAIVLGLAAILRPATRARRPVTPAFRTDEVPVPE
jgi:drug/metabolite transporter (DMT)-like permease